MSDRQTIREARDSDLPRIVQFNQAMALETEELELDTATVTEGVKAVLGDPSLGFYTLAEVDDVVVAGLMVTWEWSDWRNGRFWWIQSVYVDPDYRRRGLLSALYNSIRDRAAADSRCCGLRLYVERENTVAQQSYRKLGMDETVYRLYEEDFE